MKRCPVCQGEFPVPPGGAIPYRCPHCERLVLGDWHVLEWIGGGGMGDVYRAIDPQSSRAPVAIKVPKIDVDPLQARRRFARETAASQRLQHENVVRALGDRRAALLRNHGLCVAAGSPEEALAIAVMVERVAHIFFVAEGGGGAASLPPDSVEAEQAVYRMRVGLPEHPGRQ